MRLAKAKIQGESLVHLTEPATVACQATQITYPVTRKGRTLRRPLLPFPTSHRLFVAKSRPFFHGNVRIVE